MTTKIEILSVILNSQAVTEIVKIALVAIVAWVANKIKTYLNTKTKKDTAKTVVLAVEQIYQDLHGEEKLAKGLEMFAKMLTDKGIKATSSELECLLESAVGEFNNVFFKEKEEIEVEELSEEEEA